MQLSVWAFSSRHAAVCIQARDIKMALQYEAHEFLAQAHLERKFVDNYREEQQHTYNTDEDDDDDEITDET